jgi:hypothetical protein
VLLSTGGRAAHRPPYGAQGHRRHALPGWTAGQSSGGPLLCEFRQSASGRPDRAGCGRSCSWTRWPGVKPRSRWHLKPGQVSTPLHPCAVPFPDPVLSLVARSRRRSQHSVQYARHGRRVIHDAGAWQIEHRPCPAHAPVWPRPKRERSNGSNTGCSLAVTFARLRLYDNTAQVAQRGLCLLERLPQADVLLE